MPFFESFDKTPIYYESSAGAQPYTLIILHGWAVGRIENYKPFRQYLDCFNLVFWDARNHGKTAARVQATISDLAHDLRHFLREVYKEKYPVIVIGHSLGAMTLFEYVGRYGTELISKIVIIDQSPRLLTDAQWKLGMFGDCPAEKNEEIIRALATDPAQGLIHLTSLFLNKEFISIPLNQARFSLNAMPVIAPEAAPGLINIWRSFTAEDFRPFIKKIDIPVLLLYGEKSQFYLKETGEWMQDNIAGSRLKIFPRGDHNPFLAEPNEFFQSIKGFVLE